MRRFLALVLLASPSAVLAQAKRPAATVQIGVAADQSLDSEDGRWASLGLAWNLGRYLDVAGRAEFATRTVPTFVCAFTCMRSGGYRENTSAVIGELAWWSGRADGLHAVVAPGAALQHMSSARRPSQRRDWVSPQISAGVAYARGHHLLSGGARWRSDNQWVHSSTRFALAWWLGWQWRKSAP